MKTKLEDFKIRFATIKDTSLILDFIKELAEYEKMLSEVIATEAILKEFIFEKKRAEVIIGELKGEPVAFALFFSNFSTFLGRPGLYLEDIFVKPEYRGKGIGKLMISYLAKIAIDRDWGRLEWSCLNWNTPSIEFYQHIGAVPMDKWTVFRMDKKTLASLANEFYDD